MVKWVKICKTEKIIEIELVRLTEVCDKVLSEKNAISSLKQHCYCPMLLMRTTKTAICLQRPFFNTFMGFDCVLAKFHEQYFTDRSN